MSISHVSQYVNAKKKLDPGHSASWKIKKLARQKEREE